MADGEVSVGLWHPVRWGLYGHGVHLLGFLVAVLVLALVAGLVALAVSALMHRRHHGAPRAAGPTGGVPEAILRERFARGEIDEAEYRRSIDVLRHTPH